MKISSRQIFYGGLIGLIIVGLGWWFHNRGSQSEPYTPATVSGVIIDQTGNKYTGATGTLSLIGANGAVGATGTISNEAYLLQIPTGFALPATVKCVTTNPAGITSYSGVVVTDPQAVTEYLILDTSNKTPELDVIFLAHSGTPTPPAVTIVNLTEGGATPTEVAKSTANAPIAWVRFTSLTAGNTYKFTFTPAGGQQVIKQFTAPSDISTTSSVSYSFFLN